MEKLTLDTGVQAYKINGGGVLRFNPGDPNIYARFLDSLDNLRTLEKELAQQAEKLEQEDGAGALRLLARADQEAKKTLSWVFGAENDFDEILGGVNLLAIGANGKRVVTNFFAAVEPILTVGAERCAQQQEQAAVVQAKARRAGQ